MLMGFVYESGWLHSGQLIETAERFQSGGGGGGLNSNGRQ